MRRTVNGAAGRWGSRFDADEANPIDSIANLVDVMLVFACGLMAALLLGNAQSSEPTEGAAQARGRERAPLEMAVRRGKELPSVPEGMRQRGSGFEVVGRVFRDPKTNKLILVGDDASADESESSKRSD